MKKLTPKEQNFAELCVTLGNQTEAYRQAYNPKNKDGEWVKVEASKTANLPNVSLTIENIRKEAKEDHGIDRAFILAGLLKVISDADYTFELGKDNDLSKKDVSAFYRIKEQTNSSVKLKAFEMASKMLGLNAPEEVNHTHTLKTYKTNWS